MRGFALGSRCSSIWSITIKLDNFVAAVCQVSILAASGWASCYVLADGLDCCKTKQTTCSDGQSPPRQWVCTQTSSNAGTIVAVIEIAGSGELGQDEIAPPDDPKITCVITVRTCGDTPGACNVFANNQVECADQNTEGSACWGSAEG